MCYSVIIHQGPLGRYPNFNTVCVVGLGPNRAGNLKTSLMKEYT